MNLHMTAFITASIAVHAGALLMSPRQLPLELDIGGQAQALQVSLAALPSPKPAQTDLAALEAKPELRRRTPVPQPPEPVPSTAATAVPKDAPKVVPDTNQELPDVAAVQAEPDAVTLAVTPPQPSSLTISQHISAALHSELARRFEYPWLARKRGWQGEVTLSLRVADNGHLSDWEIFKTSGHSVLDKSALKAARAIHHLPQARGLLNGRSLQLTIPVRYQLLDS